MTFALLGIAGAALGCGPDHPGPPTPAVEVGDASEDLEGAKRAPAELLVLGEDYAARDVPSLEETRQALAGADLAPLRFALLSGGHTSEEATALVYSAAGHGSGQPWDPMRYRHEQIRQAYIEATDRFREALDRAEADLGVTIDRNALAERGVIFGFGSKGRVQ